MNMQSEQINELAKALAAAQGKIENATLNKINPHFKSKYADLAAVIDSFRKHLSAAGIAVTQTTEIREGGTVLRTTLMHGGSGQWIASEFPLPTVARLQEMGAALTYVKRYSLSAMICVAADEDDDANAAEDGKIKIDATGRAPKPGKVEIAKPASKYTKPVALVAPGNPDDGEGWKAFCRELMAGIAAVGEQDEWLIRNEQSLKRLADEQPGLHKTLTNRLTPQKEAAQ